MLQLTKQPTDAREEGAAKTEVQLNLNGSVESECLESKWLGIKVNGAMYVITVSLR